MTGDTGRRIDSTIDLVLAQIIAPVRQIAIRRRGILAARFDLFPVCVTIGAERLLMAGGAGVSRSGINFVFEKEIRCLVVKSAPGVGMTFGAVGHGLDRLGVNPGDTRGVRAGIQDTCKQRNHQNQ